MKRNPNESYEDYKKRRKRDQLITKIKLAGNYFWRSMDLGTLVTTPNHPNRNKNERDSFKPTHT